MPKAFTLTPTYHLDSESLLEHYMGDVLPKSSLCYLVCEGKNICKAFFLMCEIHT